MFCVTLVLVVLTQTWFCDYTVECFFNTDQDHHIFKTEKGTFWCHQIYLSIIYYNLILRFQPVLTRKWRRSLFFFSWWEVLPALFLPSAPTDSWERSGRSVQSVPQRQQPDADVQRPRPPRSCHQLAVESLEPVCPERHSERGVSFFYPDFRTHTHTWGLLSDLKHNRINSPVGRLNVHFLSLKPRKRCWISYNIHLHLPPSSNVKWYCCSRDLSVWACTTRADGGSL